MKKTSLITPIVFVIFFVSVAFACNHDNIVDPGEVCDGINVNGHTCTTIAAGFVSGEINCSTDCKSYDVSQCKQGNTINVVDANGNPSCEQNDVQKAIDEASDGDTVIVAEGTCIWNTNIAIHKSIILKGEGQNKTIIIPDKAAISVTGMSKKPFRITGFTFINQNQSSNIIFAGKTVSFGVITTDAFSIDYCSFKNFKGNAIQIFGYIKGTINNCIFENGSRAILVQWDNANSWNRAPAFGTDEFVVIEDSVFTNTIAIDSDSGGRFVLRKNNLIESNLTAHGACTKDTRGTHSYEIYDNTINFTGWDCMYLRGGTGAVYNNTLINCTNGIRLANYQSCTACQSPWNTICIEYPCQDQIGRTTNQALDPLYLWNNTLDRNSTNAIAAYGSDCNATKDIIQENRDYYNNTQKTSYVPYPYPHPLTLIEPKVTEAPVICTTFTYTNWNTCANGTQTRNVLTSLPPNCNGGTPIITQTCIVIPPTQNPICTQHIDRFTRNQILEAKTNWLQKQLTLQELILRAKLWKYCN